MTKTTKATETATCRRCHATLTSTRSVQRGIGPVCERNERRERQEDARIAAIDAAASVADFTAFKDAASIRDKAVQLLIDRSLTPTRADGIFVATSSDGTSTYVVDLVEKSCTCKAGRRLGRCNHLAAAAIAAQLAA